MSWKPISGYEDLYEINESGEVRNKFTGAMLYGNVNSYGYRVVALTKHGHKKDYKLHRLIAQAFIPNPNDFDCVNHIDGDKLNNSIENLEWCTKGMNNSHAQNALGVDRKPKAVAQATLDGKIIAIYPSLSVAAERNGVTPPIIGAVCDGTAPSAAGYRWFKVDVDFDYIMREARKSAIQVEIKRLSQELSQLS